MNFSTSKIICTLCISLIIFIALFLNIYAIGTGGILNIVPQASVKINNKLCIDCKVYVHPLEYLTSGVRGFLILDFSLPDSYYIH